MFALGIDTTGKQGSVALVEFASAGPRLKEMEQLAGGRASELLLPSIAGMLARNHLELDAVELIGVASGPGSFTGLRVALATVKGIAEAWGTAVVAVSVLEAVALGAGHDGRVMAALDAQRSEIFFGEYTVSNDVAQQLKEGIAGFGDFVAASVADTVPVFTPDSALCERLHKAGVAAGLVAAPTAQDFAHIAYRRFLSGERADLVTLDANYLRRSDAELFSAPKLGIVPRPE